MSEVDSCGSSHADIHSRTVIATTGMKRAKRLVLDTMFLPIQVRLSVRMHVKVKLNSAGWTSRIYTQSPSTDLLSMDENTGFDG